MEEQIPNSSTATTSMTSYSNNDNNIVDLTILCRMCAQQCNEDEYSCLVNPGSPIATKLRDYLNIELESDSTYLPKQICQNCYEALNKWSEVRNYVQKSEEFYQHQVQLRHNSQPEFINTYNNCYIKKEIEEEEVMTINVNPELIYNNDEYNGEKCEDNYDYPCGLCELGYNDINLFENHCKNHVDITELPCGICSCTFGNIQLLLHHLIEHKNDPNKKLVFNCDICNTEYNCKKNLLLHIKIIHNNTNMNEPNFENLFSNPIEQEYPLYHCGTCKEDYVGMKNFARHFSINHKEYNELICSVCNCKFKQLQLLLKHEQNHKVNKTKTTYICPYCKDIFKRNGTLHNHIRNKHSDKISNSKNNINTYNNTYKCGICKLGFSHIVDFAKHFPVKHSHYDELPCGICNAVFNKLPLLLRHEQEHKRNYNMPMPRVPQVNIPTPTSTITSNIKKENMIVEFTCKFCTKKFKDHTEYCKHMNKHEPTICPHCKNAFETEHQLRAHILSRHPQGSCKKRRIPCPICGKFFTQNSAMKAHMELHSNARNYVCEFCSKSYRSLSTLLHHRRLHTSNRKFYCNFCQRPFNFKSALKKHIMLHINYLPNKCRFCDKRFNTITVLKKHIQMKHLGILHHCIRCNKGFHDIRNCRRHMKTICQVPFEEIPYKRDRQFIYNQAVVK